MPGPTSPGKPPRRSVRTRGRHAAFLAGAVAACAPLPGPSGCGAFCQGFRITVRGRGASVSSLMHVGFRCAADGDRPQARGGRLFTPNPSRAAKAASLQEAS